MPFFSAPDGIRLHYEIEGSGPPLVLHLGSGGDAGLWRAAGYVDLLAKSNACVLFDHRGHGPSDHPKDVLANHIDRYVADLIALSDHLNLERISFFGWSTAVSIGLKAAQQHPDRFSSLVLFGPVASRTTPDQIAASTQTRLAGMRERGWRFILDDMVATEKYPVPRWFLDRVMATDTGPWFAYTEARPLWNWSPWDAMPAVKAPTLLLAGELEDPDDVMKQVAATMPNARRVRIPEREHINAFLYCDYVAPIVRDFLATIAGVAQA